MQLSGSRYFNQSQIRQQSRGILVSPSVFGIAKPQNDHLELIINPPPIVRRKKPFKPIGIVVVFFPGIPEFEVYFQNREPVEEFRQTIESKIGISTEPYYIVSPKGIIKPGHTLDDYCVTDGTTILFVEKGIRHAEAIESRDFWLKTHKERTINPNMKIVFPNTTREKPKPKPVKKRKAQEQTTVDALQSFLKSVNLDFVL
ncbi:hypothetical protein TVAG_189700 [Trichomonas vaginalis G3]|uniref:Ubiquitin-like domain-containing protein n=1 Tax=Trichomonas vaginalis (strain ATCC PRA-98 / G3) TaxID=412133 RepID=A2DKA2_TRIV3|nr:ubiquitin-like family [Trichomonas vaginalis G3]EAY19079.1 hypothetical protein TVAG_189700 [Trichomonas vaginalis G3]KAI5490379.1 ubiquitin-like family [Trichomonas vaginalis G3]|eukprot:XP_001580065.1 hypothetical protein [Trichomonas vaginalis G3]